jgi:DNA-binding HxlR family transcriptional regulator
MPITSAPSTYGDYCPIATGVDVLGDRWTPLVIRELMVGATGFNEIHRGIPRISRSLLAQRLRQLERWGLVEREETAGRGRAVRYTLTEPGQALTPIVWAMGHWAAQWCFDDPTDEDCNGISIIWRLHQDAIPAKLPTTRTVVHMVLTGVGGGEGWLDINGGAVTVCKDDQGYDVDLVVEADTRQMHRWLVGRASFRDLVADGQARLVGPSRLARSFPGWFNVTSFAQDVRRPEQRMGTVGVQSSRARAIA